MGEVERTTGALSLFQASAELCAEYWEKKKVRGVSQARWRWGLAVVAAAALAAVLLHRPALQPPTPEARQAFVRIPYVVPPAPYERTSIVHMDVPVAALIAAGLRMDEAAGASVPADVLVGQDDRPLAIRVWSREQ
jgi:hypothetical protein